MLGNGTVILILISAADFANINTTEIVTITSKTSPLYPPTVV